MAGRAITVRCRPPPRLHEGPLGPPRRAGLNLTWERTDKVDALRREGRPRSSSCG